MCVIYPTTPSIVLHTCTLPSHSDKDSSLVSLFAPCKLPACPQLSFQNECLTPAFSLLHATQMLQIPSQGWKSRQD